MVENNVNTQMDMITNSLIKAGNKDMITNSLIKAGNNTIPKEKLMQLKRPK